MHELSIAMNIVRTACEQQNSLPENQIITRIYLKMGKFTAVDLETLRFCFGLLAKGTELAGAVLEIEELPVVIRCPDCGAVNTLDIPHFTCPACKGAKVDLAGGREMFIDSFEVEESFKIPDGGAAECV